MRPGQLHLNEFEVAVLAAFAEQEPSIASSLIGLRVLSRTFTGVGSSTNFHSDPRQAESSHPPIGLRRLINVPGVPDGVGAALFFSGPHPKMLEFVTYGHVHWDGLFDGFSIG